MWCGVSVWVSPPRARGHGHHILHSQGVRLGRLEARSSRRRQLGIEQEDTGRGWRRGTGRTAWFRSPFVVVVISLVQQAGGREAETEREKRRIPRRPVNRPMRAGWREHSIYMFKARLIPPCHAGAESRPQVPCPRDDVDMGRRRLLGRSPGRHEGRAQGAWKLEHPDIGCRTPLTISFLQSIVGPCFGGWVGEGRRETARDLPAALQPTEKLTT